ncbi:Protein CBG08543 [Caenorhabditis briggsae]|uniref:Protein CBG08543 n=1 Tax=Caenorhabditis briggsae TaxID=6238 RepID=A8X759_CAEBR|nr:Protein CBG08543 [Caenorhabditis briggsae]CAP28470.1 Protein CBG08543 [Caenorhabditis briggsae]
MLERVLSVFIFVLYLFDTVFASQEEHNKGKDNMYKRKISAVGIKDRGVRVEQFAVPS